MASSQIIIFAIIATSIATYISRFMGALTSEKVSVKSKIFNWFNCVAYSTLAALLGRMIIFPAGVLADSELIMRLIVFFTCIAIFLISKNKKKYTLCSHDVLEEVKKHIKIPICVIGGINHENIKSFNKIKPDMISMISGIFSEQKPSKIVTIMNTFNE